jgi:hypothetical protein
LAELFQTEKLLTARLDCAKTVPFRKASFLKLLKTMAKMQGAQRSCMLVFSKGAIFDALDKFGEGLTCFLAEALADNLRTRSNRVGCEHNNLDFIFIPAQDASLYQLRRLAHFLASVLQKADEYAVKLGSKYVGKILKNVEGNRWPFDFWEPDQPRSPAGELEVDLLKTFTRIHLSLVNEKESTAIKQYIREGKCDILEGIGDSDDDGDAGDEEPNQLHQYIKHVLLNERQKYVMQGDSEADITQFLNKTREELFKEAMQEDFALVDVEEEDSSGGFVFSAPSGSDSSADGERGNSSGGFVFSAGERGNSSGGFAFSAPFGSNGLFGGTTAAPASSVASRPPADSARGTSSFGYQTPASVNFGYQKPAATASAIQDSKPPTTTPKTASLPIVETVSSPTVLAETSTATKPAAMPKPAIPDVKDKTLKVGASTVVAETSTAAKPAAMPKPAAKPAIPDVKGTKLNVGDRVRVKATGQEGVLRAKAWVRLDGDEKNTQFKHADL